MFAVSKCQMDAPIVLSWPHFLHANSSFLKAVDGLNPDQDKHGFYFDIQQVSIQHQNRYIDNKSYNIFYFLYL